MTIIAPETDELLANLEHARLATLDSLGLLDTPPEREFDAIVQLAQSLVGCKIALVSLVDKHRQWFKAKVGLDVDQTPRELAFCAHTIASDSVMIIPDASKDSRFSSNPLVTGAPDIRFYAGVPIRADMLGSESSRAVLGTLCVIDDEPREIDPADLKQLVQLAQLVEALIAARSSSTAAVRLAEERGRNLQMLNRKHRQLRQAERMANMGSWRLTLADNQTEWSEQTYAIHGLPVGNGQPLVAALDFFPPKARMIITNALEQTIRSGEPFDVETDFNTAQGHYRRVRSMGEIEMENGQPVALIGVFQDVTARFTMEEALRTSAQTDDLTQIANRGRFSEFADERIRDAGSSRERCAILLLDLDHFKSVNDKFGHHAGDDVLRVMASRLKAEYLKDCFAARLGGDEFVLLVSNQHILKDITSFLRRLLFELQYSVCSNGLTINVSATIGACWLGGEASNRSEILRQADAALYEAKSRQRGSAMIAGQDELILPFDDRLGRPNSGPAIIPSLALRSPTPTPYIKAVPKLVGRSSRA
ncbi:diguanylate cyclase [Altererythrobacter sp. KTW20L]|uniref:sensor domain-containing diguanylate cyclase n=1 Tax=Altererythrobacter sp. KTW20L TaxID=2942210 RepID=UPI0020C038F4|nr:diguanylate cyclase [Altererythrobacter sp. KTW20L]MCL6250565.1 diguanylate cyclase [Altererythrobacter sp. KTW20L]